LRAASFIPAGHKIALEDIPAGALVRRYGCVIGAASASINAGDHVHTHNMALAEMPELETGACNLKTTTSLKNNIPAFLGYPRPDGRAGTRNYIAVASVSNCAAHAAELVAARFASEALPDGVDG